MNYVSVCVSPFWNTYQVFKKVSVYPLGEGNRRFYSNAFFTYLYFSYFIEGEHLYI